MQNPRIKLVDSQSKPVKKKMTDTELLYKLEQIAERLEGLDKRLSRIESKKPFALTMAQTPVLSAKQRAVSRAENRARMDAVVNRILEDDKRFGRD